MFEDKTLIRVDGVGVLVRRRPGGTTFDIEFEHEPQDGPPGYTFGSNGPVTEAQLLAEIAATIRSYRADGVRFVQDPPASTP
ncbi:hypothetical protein [Cellulomonas wangsupingiae]|uniref:Uncharacterized protein n=1 Tax=Cellulomonas wangsupingiae TaxID=2968085 RepID=A0ABY5K555_9CELL|nr:hypothetical protein [Cellulomonas wangsupingiae]MCC2333839.1 hypothetical protein [Cellulomonas wangsupingiae]MCM0639332.1 hypothetical protein [Cellulomonas wangsupingiae]UUI65100.1 hypothetical protein NP075_18640 [Cellulomonas wangsupingiae]